MTFFEPLSEGGKAMVQVSGRDTVMAVEASSVEPIFADFGSMRPLDELAEEPAAE